MALEGLIPSKPELIAINLNGVDDVLAVLRVLSLLKDDMHLNQFDSIRIHRGGVDLLLVLHTGGTSESGRRASGRSVYVEVNEYRHRLHQVGLFVPHFKC